ncbi:tRNA (guanosine(46)-N7)-methyltransferase TrmB [Halosquirtibacter xylanolyticus]|uniref:tRNA (guanosine(46)-N7)-methyltransferase TrmB n=1 Tax=Halosquirtibacter xylanolyticus TaxID=3374599 RepID=UPI00374A90BA|nr:tRNA (guanosine(46)-N7)-methyltransferase TrmB [Prolixibacteraceae bacterium]
MGKNKLKKFSEMETFPNVFQNAYRDLQEEPFENKGKWASSFFKNDNPIVVEVGCGKGEYTVGLAKKYPNKNFIGVDIKGSRMWLGAKESIDNNMTNVAFIRTHVELLHLFFDTDEISEIWITFADPQMKHTRRRLTSTRFMEHYRSYLKENGLVHLKTDSDFLYTYSDIMVKENKFEVLENTNDLYHSDIVDDILSIRTFYEQQWLNRGKTIKYIKWKMHRNLLVEPEVDIELDDYRSFGRRRRE